MLRRRQKDQLYEWVSSCFGEKSLSRGGSLHEEEKRDRVIRVRQWTYDKLGELGSSKNDFDDVIFLLIEFWERHHRRK